MYFNSYGTGNNSNNFNNNYNNQQNNQKSPGEQKPNPAGTFLMLLLVLTAVIMVFHVVDVVQTNKKLEEDISEKDTNKKEENDNLRDNENSKDKDENKDNNKKDDEEVKKPEKEPTIEELNKDELVKLCKLVDSEGSYKYDEYVDYVNSFDSKDLTLEEKYEIMSRKNYCYNNSCVKIEKEGIINYVSCSTGEFSRITFEEYQKLQTEQAKVNISLATACLNVDNKGYYDSGAATGIRVKCENYICSLDYEGEKITKNCKE